MSDESDKEAPRESMSPVEELMVLIEELIADHPSRGALRRKLVDEGYEETIVDGALDVVFAKRMAAANEREAERSKVPTFGPRVKVLGVIVIVAVVALAWKFPPSFVLLNRAAKYRPIGSGYGGYGSDTQMEAIRASDALVARGWLAVSTLVPALESEDEHRAVAASTALNGIGAPALDAMIEVLRSGSDRARAFAMIYMLKQHERGAFELVLSIAESAPNPKIRTIAHITLYGLMDVGTGIASRNESALLGIGEPWAARKAEDDLPLAGARAWFESKRGIFPTQF